MQGCVDCKTLFKKFSEKKFEVLLGNIKDGDLGDLLLEASENFVFFQEKKCHDNTIHILNDNISKRGNGTAIRLHQGEVPVVKLAENT